MVVDLGNLLVGLAHEPPAEGVEDDAGRHGDGDAQPEELRREAVEDEDLDRDPRQGRDEVLRLLDDRLRQLLGILVQPLLQHTRLLVV